MGTRRLRDKASTLPVHRGARADRRWSTIAVIALLAGSLSACGVGSASLPATLPAVGGGIIRIVTAQLADGVVGRSYDNIVETRGAFEPLTRCSVVAGNLPPGLNTGPSGPDCAIIGVPTATGTFSFTLEIRDNALIPQTATVSLTITVRPEFTITAFQVVDAVAGRTYNNSFQVTTNLQNDPAPLETGSTEAGNGPAASCSISGLPANLTGTCTPNTSGVMDVTLTSTGALAAGGPLNLTLAVTDQNIIQLDFAGSPILVVPAVTLDNTTTAPFFTPTLTVRNEFQLLTPAPLDAVDAITGRSYDRSFTFTTDLADNGDDIPNDVNTGEAGNGPLNTCTVLGLPADFNGSCVLDPGGLTGTVTIASAGVTTLPSTTALTLQLTDAEIPQGGATVVPPFTQGLPFNLTVRGEYSITDTGLPGGGTTLPTAVEDQLYDFTFTVTTDTVAGASDIGQAAELGNGAVADCTVTGLPNGLGFNLVGTAANGCTIQITGTVDVNPAGPGPANFPGIVVSVTDMPIPDTTVDVVPAATLQQTNVDISVALPMTFSLRTDAAGGTFNDPASGGVAPDAVLGRTYGNSGTGLRDLLFEATGGIAPYTWAVTGVAPTPIGCAQEGTNNEFFRCNSGGAAVTGATSALVVQVTDTGSGGVGAQVVSTDVDGHGGHTINVQAALALTPNGAGNAPPAGVVGRTYGDAGSTCPGPVACSPLTYTAGGGLQPYIFTLPTSGNAPAASQVPAAVACTAGATVATCTSGAGTVTAATGNYPFTVQVDETANDTTPTATASQARSITIVPELEFRLVTLPNNTSGPFTDTDPPLPGVEGRLLSDFASFNCGATGTDPCEALGFLPTVNTGLGSLSWDLPVAGLPGDLGCLEFTAQPDGVRAMACFADAPTNAAAAPQPTMGTFNFTVTLRDPGNAAVPAGAQSTDNLAHATHDIVINDPLALALSVGDATDLPDAVDGRQYADSLLSTCGAGGATACQALTYTASGGLGDATVDGSYLFSENATGLLVPGAGFPDAIACATGVNPAADTRTCNAGGAFFVNVTTPGTYTPAVTANDVGNAVTANSSNSATAATEQRNLAVNAALGLAISPTAPLPTGVDLRVYGSGAGCSGGACVPATWTASGGLGDPTVDGSYLFSENALALAAPGAGFPNGIGCVTGLNPDANDHFCAAGVAVDVTTTGVFAPEVTVVDAGNETTPIGASVALGTTLTVNPALEFTLFVDNVFTGPAPVPTDPPPQGVAGRFYADAFAFFVPPPLVGFLTFAPTAGSGLGGYVWSPAGGALPPDVICAQGFVFFPGNFDCLTFFPAFIGQPAPGSFLFTVTLNDSANLSTPSGAQSVDNLGHPDHTIVINPALSVATISPMQSSFVGDTAYAQMLMSAGGLAGQTWSTPTFPAAAATPCENFALSAGGVVDNTVGVTTAGTCTFTANVNDPGNAVTEGSALFGTTGTAPLGIPISAAGGPVIDNDFLINGLEGFFYSQSFTATGVTGTAAWVPGGSVGTDCPTPAGTIPTGTALGAATGVLDGPSTAAGTFSFGVCVEDDAVGAFNLKNYTVVINPSVAYVTNFASDNVTPIDFATDTAGTNIALAAGAGPRAVAFTPDGTRALVTNQNNDSISVINTQTGAVVASVDVSFASFGIAVSPDGTSAYFTKLSGDDVGILDLTTDPPTLSGTTIPLGTSGGAPAGPHEPRGIAIADTASGLRAYVANNASASLSVLDIEPGSGTENTELTTIAVGSSPVGVTADASGGRVYVTNNVASGRFRAINTATNAVTANPLLGGDFPEGIALTPDGRFGYAAQGGDDIVVINTENNTDDATTGPQPPLPNTVFTTITSAGTGPSGVAATPDGAKVYVSNTTTDDVSVVDTATNTITGPVNVGTTPSNQNSVAMMPYPVLHFTRAVDGVVGRRILAQGDDDNPPNYSDFIRVLGGVAPYTFADGDAGGTDELADDTDCTGLALNTATGEVSGNPNPGGGVGVKDCDFIIRVTDSATVPQTIQGDFRLVITED